MFEDVAGVVGRHIGVAGHEDGPHPRAGQQQHGCGRVVVGHEAHAVAFPDALLLQPSHGAVGLFGELRPAQAGPFGFHHHLLAQSLQAGGKETVQREVMRRKAAQHVQGWDHGVGPGSGPS